jgi:hypothetical protein
VVTTPQHSLRDANSPAGLLSIAEETLAEFLSKATGTAVDWVQMPGMKVIRISYHYLSVILSVDIYGNM